MQHYFLSKTPSRPAPGITQIESKQTHFYDEYFYMAEAHFSDFADRLFFMRIEQRELDRTMCYRPNAEPARCLQPAGTQPAQSLLYHHQYRPFLNRAPDRLANDAGTRLARRPEHTHPCLRRYPDAAHKTGRRQLCRRLCMWQQCRYRDSGQSGIGLFFRWRRPQSRPRYSDSRRQFRLVFRPLWRQQSPEFFCKPGFVVRRRSIYIAGLHCGSCGRQRWHSCKHPPHVSRYRLWL